MNTLRLRTSATKMGVLIIMLCLLASNSGISVNAHALTSNLVDENSIFLDWNTFLGGTGVDVGASIVVDNFGNIFVAGYGDSSWGNNPIRPYSGGEDIFVAKLSQTGQLLWNTFLGGLESEDANVQISLDSSNNIYVSGNSISAWGMISEEITRGVLMLLSPDLIVKEI